MDLHKLLDTTKALKSDSVLSRNTSILKTLSFVEPSSTVSTLTSFSHKDSDKDSIKELIKKVTGQDLILSIIKKCVEDGTTLDANLKNKIKKIIKLNSFKASYNEKNLNEILALNEGNIELRGEDDMKLTEKEAGELTEVIQKCIDQIHTQIVLERRSTSNKSNTDLIVELQAKIQCKYNAIESLMNNIDEIQDQMLHITRVEYHEKVTKNNHSIAQMLTEHISKLHDDAVISLSQCHANESQYNSTKNLLDTSIPSVDESLSSLEFSTESLQIQIDNLEARVSAYRALESNPSDAAVFKAIRKLNKNIKQKRAVLKMMKD